MPPIEDLISYGLRALFSGDSTAAANSSSAPTWGVKSEAPFLGFLTFDAEGSGDPTSPYFSRRLHHPTLSSGVTIGRGYDMKYRSYDEVLNDLMASGLSGVIAEQYADGAGLTGDVARRFVKTSTLPFISTEVEQNLFRIAYSEAEDDIKRIIAKPDVVQRYGAVEWGSLDTAIQEILVDLRYRGDYSPRTREIIQPSVVANDVAGLAAIFEDRTLWSTVPKDRFERRRDYFAEALTAE